MGENRIERLHVGQREALRLYFQRLRTDAIATAMGVSRNTANGYLSEAARLLDVGGRPAAARVLAEFEATHPEARGRFSVGDAALQQFLRADPVEVAQVLRTVEERPSLLPLRRGAAHNDLSIAARLAWIPLIAIACAIAFGMLAIGFRTLSDLYRSISS